MTSVVTVASIFRHVEIEAGDGAYVMLGPLSDGAHTIHFGGSFPAFNFSLDITYHLVVGGV